MLEEMFLLVASVYILLQQSLIRVSKSLLRHQELRKLCLVPFFFFFFEFYLKYYLDLRIHQIIRKKNESVFFLKEKCDHAPLFHFHGCIFVMQKYIAMCMLYVDLITCASP